MDGTSTSDSHNSTTNGTIETTGPYIVGSQIDLGTIDNVDSIGHQVGSIINRRRRTREHIELQESEITGL